MAPQNFTMRITLAVTTLLAATTFHLSLLSGIPPTGHLTVADKNDDFGLCAFPILPCLFSVHNAHGGFKEAENALKIKSKALRFLAVMLIIIVLLVVLL